jgi:phage repressor protein C with HTH and peptisase S24 domain
LFQVQISHNLLQTQAMTEKTSQVTGSNFGSEFGPLSSNFDQVLERILRASSAKTDSDLGRALGITPQSVTGVRKRRQIPPSWIVTVACKYSVSADWLLFGESIQPAALPSATQPSLTLIHKVKARLSAGTGSLETSAEFDGLYAFRTEFLTRKGSVASMVLMDVFGESMSPAIEDGDTVLIDQSQTEIIPGRIYAVGMDEEVLVKFVDKTPGKYVLRSANERYEPTEVDLKREDLNVRIIGRVIWWCREAR